MRRMTWVLIVAVSVLSLSTAYSADKKPKKSPEDVFAKADKDADGKLTLEEFVGKRSGEKKEKAEKMFARRDKDGDKSLTLEEFKAKAKKKNK